MIAYHHFVHRGSGQRAGRTYSVWMQQDLFGQWVVVRVHGGRSRAARQIVTVVESPEVGEALIRQICGVRERHGYGAMKEHVTGQSAAEHPVQSASRSGS